LISKKKVEKIKVIAVDVDGVLTDGRFFPAGKSQLRCFHVRDGLGFKLMSRSGWKLIILTGRDCTAAERKRWKNLGVSAIISLVEDKEKALENWLKKNGFGWDQVCYVGDDLPDIKPMKKAGLSFCPADACREIRQIADITCQSCGGAGVIREIAELLLRKGEKWAEMLRFYGRG